MQGLERDRQHEMVSDHSYYSEYFGHMYELAFILLIARI